MSEPDDDKSMDVVGLGKIAKAIPQAVYKQSAATVLKTFEQVVAPITETTAGLGRYIRQRFDNLVEAEKAVAAYTIEKAVSRAKRKAEQSGCTIGGPAHIKSFIRTIDEAARETDPILHELWTNLLASQLLPDSACHPHFVEILAHFSPAEAKILASLKSWSQIGPNSGGYIFFNTGPSFDHWTSDSDDDLVPWTQSCQLLCDFQFAAVVGPRSESKADLQRRTAILFRTELGDSFLKVVTP